MTPEHGYEHFDINIMDEANGSLTRQALKERISNQ